MSDELDENFDLDDYLDGFDEKVPIMLGSHWFNISEDGSVIIDEDNLRAKSDLRRKKGDSSDSCFVADAFVYLLDALDNGNLVRIRSAKK